jgi:hypothetical protein
MELREIRDSWKRDSIKAPERANLTPYSLWEKVNFNFEENTND